MRCAIPIERLKLSSNASDELERAAVNVEVHFGDELAHQLREPLRAYRQIIVATACRMSNVSVPSEARVSPDLVRRWKDVMYAGTTASGDIDQLSIEMDDAKLALKAASRSFVKAPTFGEFLLANNLIDATRLILRRLALLLSRPGHGKIAVYATMPLAVDGPGDA
jgi:hypothetical protein